MIFYIKKTNDLKRFLRLFGIYTKLGIKGHYFIKPEFILSNANFLLSIASIFIFWKSIITFSNSFGNWSTAELTILSAFGTIAIGIENIVGTIRLLPERLRGQLDKYLCRPIMPLFGILSEQSYILFSIQQFVTASIIIILVCVQYNIAVYPINIILSIVLVSIGRMIFIALSGLIACLGFWLGRIDSLFLIVENFERANRYPVEFFPGIIKTTFIYLVPIAFYSTFPAKIFLNQYTLSETVLIILQALLLLTIFSALFGYVWKQGIKRYESCGN